MADASTLILHQYEVSPFSEKVRVALGIKGLAWQACNQPSIMPKPENNAFIIEFLLSERGQRVAMERGVFPITPKFKVQGKPGSSILVIELGSGKANLGRKDFAIGQSSAQGEKMK